MRKQTAIFFLASVMCFSVFTLTGQTITSNQTGTNNGFFYTFWTDGGGSVSMTLGSGGNFSVTWSNCGNFVVGKGWSTGSSRTITWSGSASGAQYYGVYGWMQNPLVEYYIPRSGGTNRGTYQADGTTYTLYTNTRTNQPSIEGTRTFEQYFCGGGGGGSVNFGQHLDGWRALGMGVGSQNYQVVAVEGWGGSSGSANVTVGEGGSTVTNPPSTTAAPTATPAPGATNPPSGSCGTCNWYGTNYPMCCNTTSGWGWENSQSCISQSTCDSQGGATNPPSATAAPTATPAPGATAAPTNPPSGSSGCTCAAGCNSQTSISSNFTKDGAGEFCFVASSLGSYINSWNLDSLTVNGTNVTNKYASVSSLPKNSDGKYYIYYKASYSWAHFEAR